MWHAEAKKYCYSKIFCICKENTCIIVMNMPYVKTIWTASSEFGTYRLCEQRTFRRACASAQSRQNRRCSPIQAVSQEEPSDRKPDPWPLWMAGHAQLKFVMTECSKTQIRLTGLIYFITKSHANMTVLLTMCIEKTEAMTYNGNWFEMQNMMISVPCSQDRRPFYKAIKKPARETEGRDGKKYLVKWTCQFAEQ